ncbi:peptidase M29, partial [Acinetobacter baumannii]
MLVEQIEHRWLAAFRRTLELCALSAGEVVGIVAESQSRQVIVDLAQLAVQSLGATPIRVRVPTPALQAPAPVRS